MGSPLALIHSDTPRTDSAIVAHGIVISTPTGEAQGDWVDANFARTLERELAAMPKVGAAKQHDWPRLVVDMPYGGATAHFDPCDHTARALIAFLAERA